MSRFWMIFSVCVLVVVPACGSKTKPQGKSQVLSGNQTAYGESSQNKEEDGFDAQSIEEEPTEYTTYSGDGSITSDTLSIDDESRGGAFDWEPIFFNFDQAQLTTSAKETLQEYARRLRAQPSLKVLLEGHCDARGTETYNLGLGERRAQAVKRYLLQLGVTKAQLETISYGELQPLALDESEAAWAKNRRVSFSF